MFDKIAEHVREVMSHYTDSRQPTDTEVFLAWCVGEIDVLRNKLIKQEGKHKIAFWPCGTWTDYNDGDIETFMRVVGLSDDYAIMFVPEELDDEAIDAVITNYFKQAFRR